MKKIDLGQAFSILANFGVIVGIVFLAIEVRHASNATELQTIENVTNGWIGLSEAIISDPQVARAFIVGLYNPAELSDVETVQFSMYLRMFNNQVGRVRKHRDLGLVPDEEYQNSLRELATLLTTPGGELYLQTSLNFNPIILDELSQYMDQEPIVELILGRDTSALE